MNTFYYYSDECARADLPVECTLIRYLDLEGLEKKAAVIETKHPVYDAKKSLFIALAKGLNSIDELFENKSIGIFLMYFDERAGDTELDLSQGLKGVQDWGTLTLSKELAEEWQLK